jgi:hypothetical protein
MELRTVRHDGVVLDEWARSLTGPARALWMELADPRNGFHGVHEFKRPRPYTYTGWAAKEFLALLDQFETAGKLITSTKHICVPSVWANEQQALKLVDKITIKMQRLLNGTDETEMLQTLATEKLISIYKWFAGTGGRANVSLINNLILINISNSYASIKQSYVDNAPVLSVAKDSYMSEVATITAPEEQSLYEQLARTIGQIIDQGEREENVKFPAKQDYKKAERELRLLFKDYPQLTPEYLIRVARWCFITDTFGREFNLTTLSHISCWRKKWAQGTAIITKCKDYDKYAPGVPLVATPPPTTAEYYAGSAEHQAFKQRTYTEPAFTITDEERAALLLSQEETTFPGPTVNARKCDIIAVIDEDEINEEEVEPCIFGINDHCVNCGKC